MTACLMVGASLLVLADAGFTLEWQHSVERQQWREAWVIAGTGLQLTEAAVKGSGAGMEPGEGARPEDGWWVWSPGLAPMPELVLATSGATEGGWTLCSGGLCRELPETGSPTLLRPCTEAEWPERSAP